MKKANITFTGKLKARNKLDNFLKLHVKTLPTPTNAYSTITELTHRLLIETKQTNVVIGAAKNRKTNYQ